MVPDHVGEAPLAPPIDLVDRATAHRQDLGDAIGRRLDHLVVGVGGQDQQDLVLPQIHLLWTGRPHGGAGVERPSYQPDPSPSWPGPILYGQHPSAGV